MVRVGTAFGRHVHLTDASTEFRRIDAALNLELLQRVDRRQQDVGIEVHIGVVHAIECVVVPLAPAATDGQLLCGPIAALAGAGLARIGKTGRHIGRQRDQLQKIPAVEREIHDATIVDNGANRRVFGINHRRAADDLHRLFDRANGEGEIQADCLLGLQLDAVSNRALKPLQFNFYVVGSGEQVWKHVNARGVGLLGGRNPGLRIRDGDRRAGQHAAAGVQDPARDLPEGLC